MSEYEPSQPPKPEELTPEELHRKTAESQSTEPKQVHADHLHDLAGEGEGIRSDSPDQMSVFSAGEEQIVVVGQDEEGRRKQGTGRSAAEAAADAQDSKEPIGEGFYPPP